MVAIGCCVYVFFGPKDMQLITLKAQSNEIKILSKENQVWEQKYYKSSTDLESVAEKHEGCKKQNLKLAAEI